MTLDLNTKGYQGKIHETAVIHTNDPVAETVRIGISVDVQVPIIVNPRFVLISGMEGQASKRIIEITAGLDKPLQLKPDGFNLEGKVAYRIEEIEKGKKFQVIFTTEPEASGVFQGFLNLKTNYDEKPVLNIRIHARILNP